MSTLREKLIDALGAQNVLVDEPMCDHTTFKIGGPADLFVLPRSVEQIAAVVDACADEGVQLRVIGLGSDLLVADAGLRGVIMCLTDNFAEIRVEGQRLYAQAGASNEQVAEAAQAAGLAGYEFASGIPGTIGGAAIMNAGAYDGEFKNVCIELECLTPEGDVVTVSREDADWSYRHSMMNDRGYIVLSAVLELTPDDPAAIRERMDDLKRRREEKQPLEMPSAGSTFKRPEGYFAGKLIQDAGLRGFSLGGAQVSEKHCGFVVNADNATAQHVLDLIAEVQRRVFEMEGVHMEPEVRYWE